MTLEQALRSHLSHPDHELSAWALREKRAQRSIAVLAAEIRSTMHRCSTSGPLAAVLPAPMLKHVLSVDEQNRRAVAALGNRIAAEKRRDDLRRRLYPTAEEQEQDRRKKESRELCAKIKALGESLLAEE